MDKIHSGQQSPTSKKKQDSILNDDGNIQYGSISTEGDVPLIGYDDKDKGIFTKIYEFVITLTIEPVIFSFMFAYIMNASIMSNMVMDKSCLYHFNYSTEVCRNISAYPDEKENVEKLSANYSLYANLTTFVSAILMTFIATWSDKYGRKFPLLVSIAGAMMSDIGYILCAKYFESPLFYLVVSRLPSELTGGFICMLAIVFSHASEVSSEENRTVKYTAVELALGSGIAIGGLAGGFVYRYYGYFYVYVMVAAVHLLSFLWIFWVVEETTGLDVSLKWHEKARDFFTCKSFKAGVAVTCRAREGVNRGVLLLLLASMCMIVLNYEAFDSIAYIYVHHVYDWDPTIYNIVNTASWFAGTMVTMISVPILVKVFGVRDFTLGIIGTLSMIGRGLLIAFSGYHTYIYYTGLSLGIFSSMSGLAVRTGVSKLVGKEELGRVFSFLAICEAVVPMAGVIAVTQLFNATLDIFPSVTYTFGISLLLLPLGTFIWALKITKNPYSGLTSEIKEKV